jgi:ethanolamine utilization protein EutL
MAVMDPVKPSILATKVIPNVHPDFAARLKLRPDQRSLGLVTCDIDDSLYVSLDEATKMAEVEVVYAHSFYAGSGYPSGPLSGEIIGMLAGPDPAEVQAGLQACVDYAEQEAWFRSANDDDSLTFFAHTLSRTGSYLSKEAGVPEGTALGYLIAPPIEATFALDAALKAADVEMQVWWEPPSETNFSGGMLSGTQSACRAACQAFADAVLEVARHPRKF